MLIEATATSVLDKAVLIIHVLLCESNTLQRSPASGQLATAIGVSKAAL